MLESIVEKAKSGYVLMTPDGPRGPINMFKAGAVVASIRSGTALVLCQVEIAHKKIFFKSWDKFELPLPYSKIILTFTDPLIFPNDLNRDEIDLELIRCGALLNIKYESGD